MKDLLLAIQTALRNASSLAYLHSVEILDDEMLIPEEPAFPFVGLIAGDIGYASIPNKGDSEDYTVIVVVYQSLVLEEMGASIIGTSNLSDEGKGTLAIGNDIKAVLNDNFLSQSPAFYFAHRARVERPRTLWSPGDDAQSKLLVTYQRNYYQYRRLSP